MLESSLVIDSRHAGVFLSEGFKACWCLPWIQGVLESSLVKDSRHAGVFLREGFKACWSLP